MNRLRSSPLPVVQLREALRSDLDTLPDGELLDRFARYADHAAFEVLVRRHGAMVLGVCRRVLANADADDAFQATFLVLIRKAKSLRGGRLGPWLYGVAYRVALKARARETRLAEYRTGGAEMIPDPNPPAEVPDWLPILDAELAALPAKYRDPLVLCELQGKPRAEAAKALGVPEGTLSSRLARARELLRKRLLKHGTLLPSGGLAVLLSATGVGGASVPTALLTRTFELAKTGTAAGAVPAGAAQLTDEVLKGMFLTKLRFTGGALALLALATVGVAFAAWPADTPTPAEEKRAAKVAPAPTPVENQPKDKKPAADGPKLPDRDAMQGLWVLEKFDVVGKGANERELKEAKEAIGKMQMLIAGDVWWGLFSGPNGNVFPQTGILNPKKNPKWLDWRGWGLVGGTSSETCCIYELEGDTLRVCMSADNGDKARPAEFATDADSPLGIMTFHRGKMPPAAGEKTLLGSWAGEQVTFKRGPEEPPLSYMPRAEILDGYLFVCTRSGVGEEWLGGKYTVDATKNPKWVDVELTVPFGDEKTTKLYGCYEVADGRLKLALGTKRATRPLEFKDGQSVLLYDLKIVKNPPADAPMPKVKDAAKP